jgi:hypothetical protein
MKISKKTKELLKLAETKSTESAITELMDTHSACFQGEYCDLCEEIEALSDEWEIDGALLHYLARNQNLSPKNQIRVINAAIYVQGRDHEVCMILLDRANLGKEVKEFVLDPEVWSGFGNMICDSLIPKLEESPHFTYAEVEKFKNNFSC